jgi:hypothetical protein
MGSPVHALLFVAMDGAEMDTDCQVLGALRLRGVGIVPKRLVFEFQDANGLWDSRGAVHGQTIGWPSGYCADCEGHAVYRAGQVR